MARKKLDRANGFVTFDLDAAVACGSVRCAPKILAGGAGWLARSLSYRYASFGLNCTGASVGLNATPAEREQAVDALREEFGDDVAAGAVLLEPGKGLTDELFEPLRALDPRGSSWWSARHGLTAAGVVAALSSSLGELEGRSVIIEGIDAAGPALAAALLGSLAERGVVVRCIVNSSAAVRADDGLNLTVAMGVLRTGGEMSLDGIGRACDVDDAFAVPADALLAGSRAGIVTHEIADALAVGSVVPWGAIPVTAKALAALRRRGIDVLPDFVSTAGASVVRAGPWGEASWPEPDDPTAAQHVDAEIAGVLDEVKDHPEGVLVGACERAETRLRAWHETLPFGRPIA